jgi:hypothetical protein
MQTEITFRPLSEIARTALNDPELKGLTREYALPYLSALMSCEVKTDQYLEESAGSLISYALGNLTNYRGQTARQVKTELRAHL